MRIGKVIGTVTCHRLHPMLVGGQLKIVVPFTLPTLVDDETISQRSQNDYSTRETYERLKKQSQGDSSELVVYDELSVGDGEWIAFSEGAEASMPFYPNNKPVDAYAAAIIDSVELEEAALEKIRN